MDQKTIIDALQKALTGGQGSLDDLDNLLTRAKEDIAKAKQEQAAAARKAEAERGSKIAEIATNMLNREISDADMAYVMNIYFEQNKLDAVWNAKNVRELITECTAVNQRKNARTVQISDSLTSLLDEIIKDLAGDTKTSTKKDTKDDPDATIRNFLKNFGLD